MCEDFDRDKQACKHIPRFNYYIQNVKIETLGTLEHLGNVETIASARGDGSEPEYFESPEHMQVLYVWCDNFERGLEHNLIKCMGLSVIPGGFALGIPTAVMATAVTIDVAKFLIIEPIRIIANMFIAIGEGLENAFHGTEEALGIVYSQDTFDTSVNDLKTMGAQQMLSADDFDETLRLLRQAKP